MSEEPRPCKACGMPIVFLKGPNGRQIPLQKVRSVYVDKLDDQLDIVPGEVVSVSATLIGKHYVSHFETCPSASSFSKKP